MTVPLDRLYHFIENLAEQDHKQPVVIYRFFPHGSKSLADWLNLRDYDPQTFLLNVKIFCADQEPLRYDYYQQLTGPHDPDLLELILGEHQDQFPEFYCNNLKFPFGQHMYRLPVLLHSEMRSQDVIKYARAGYVMAYYWSHAIIARDWFRFAEHCEQRKSVDHTFLIYNRAWGGTREYRLKFMELVARAGLADRCLTSVNPVEPELDVRYDQHQFDQPRWRPDLILEDHYKISTAHSHYSADFDIEDYDRTDIEVVLETLFDDSRLHLTEKSLRPMACGQPFMLAGTAHSLALLRTYGFQTFSEVWDETYDTMEDPEQRMQAMVDVMTHMAAWSDQEREIKMARARQIAQANREYFFSDKFFDLVVNELRRNLGSALEQARQIQTQDGLALIDVIQRMLSLEAVQNLTDPHELAQVKAVEQTLDQMRRDLMPLSEN